MTRGLVHPILLGRQSDVARVRHSGESAVYRNYGTGLMGRFPLRPSKDVHILTDFVKSDSEGSRTLWSTKITNHTLQDRVAAFGTGLLRLAGLRPQQSQVLLALNDGIEFIISDLALASHSITSFTISSSTLLGPVFESHSPTVIIADAELLPRLLELIYEVGERSGNHTVIVVGEPSPQAMASVASTIKVLKFSEVEREGVRVEKSISPLPNPTDVFTVSFFKSEPGHIQGAQFTHENMTAGVAATRALLPLSHALSSLDTIISAHSLSTPYGRAIAYTAIFEGTSFATLKSSKLYHVEERTTKSDVEDMASSQEYPIPPPTIFFMKPGHLESAVTSIAKEASKSFILYPFARRHKHSSITEGYITKESLWDRLLFDSARAKVMGEGASMRAVIISGAPLTGSLLTPSRIMLSVPLVNCFTHPLVPGPVLASHCLDLQDFSAVANGSISTTHVGPPSVNTEAKLAGVDDTSVENGSDPIGMLLIRGPSVGKLLSHDDYVSIPSEDENEGWVSTGVRAKIQTNGTFQILDN